jgi:hypothetical protein
MDDGCSIIAIPEWRLVEVYISRPQQLADQRWALP